MGKITGRPSAPVIDQNLQGNNYCTTQLGLKVWGVCWQDDQQNLHPVSYWLITSDKMMDQENNHRRYLRTTFINELSARRLANRFNVRFNTHRYVCVQLMPVLA